MMTDTQEHGRNLDQLIIGLTVDCEYDIGIFAHHRGCLQRSACSNGKTL